VTARATVTESHSLGRFIDDEMRGRALKAEGLVKSVYKRADGPGTVMMLEGESMDVIWERMNALAFVIEGHMTLEYDEVYEI
jgi:hypothetical protein